DSEPGVKLTREAGQWAVVSGQLADEDSANPRVGTSRVLTTAWSVALSEQLPTDHCPLSTDRYTRRFLGGRQPLCGSGVTSSIALTFSPAACSAVTADSRPAPGPFTRTSISFTPNFDALAAHSSAARCAANGVLLRLPLNPTAPPDE